MKKTAKIGMSELREMVMSAMNENVGTENPNLEDCRRTLRFISEVALGISSKLTDGTHISETTLDSLDQALLALNRFEMELDNPGWLSESSETGKSLTANELAAKYELQKTGPNGKYKMDDFQPILDGSDENDKYALALIFANMFLGKNFGLSWDDLPDINSLWDCVESSDTIDELITNVKASCKERISEEGGDMF